MNEGMNGTQNIPRQSAGRELVTVLLNAVLGCFLADAAISLLDDTLLWGFHVHALGAIRGVVFVFLVIMSLLVYLLAGALPMIPKRFFLPVVLITPLAPIAVTPLLIFHYDWMLQIDWSVSLCQLLIGLGMVFWIQGIVRFQWPVFRQEQLGLRPFGWRHLCGFVAANVFLLLPGVLLCLAVYASLAVDQFSGGFLALRWEGLTMRAKTFVRDDHKSIRLIPMMHIGEEDFYSQVSKSFPSNSVIMMEGVTDNKNLLQHKLSYHRMAESLGLAEQQEKFDPPLGRVRPADVDVGDFSEQSIAFIELVSRIHSQGWKAEDLMKLSQQSEDPLFAGQLMDDLLTKRNANLVKQIEAELPGSDVIIVPWGAAHMRRSEPLGMTPIHSG
jgi:hypothetical protein